MRLLTPVKLLSALIGLAAVTAAAKPAFKAAPIAPKTPLVYKTFDLNPALPPLTDKGPLFPAASEFCVPNGGPVYPFPQQNGNRPPPCPYAYQPATAANPYWNSYNPQYCGSSGSSSSNCNTQPPTQMPPSLPSTAPSIPNLFNALNAANAKSAAEDLDPYGGSRGSIGYLGSGKLDDCGNLPEQVEWALSEAMDYRNNTCSRLANRGPNQKIVINDYSYKSKPPQMYIFDAEGKCLGKTAVTYGNGETGEDGKPLPCSGGSTHLTPPGFHLTGYHADGAKYGPDASLCMVGLEGQDSCKRGVLIHPAGAPGTASSWGCSGVGCFPLVKGLIGKGSLVYNYFGNTPLARGCSNSAGWGSHHSCGPMESAGVPQQATGTAPTPAAR